MDSVALHVSVRIAHFLIKHSVNGTTGRQDQALGVGTWNLEVILISVGVLSDIEG